MARILVVDDHGINREYLETLLRYAGYEVVQASNGAEALDLVRSEHPDLVITDVLMPVMGGVEFADRVRADATIARTPIIFYTATYRDPQAKILADSVQVTTVLVKPAEPQAILDAVSHALDLGPAPSLVPETAATYPSFLSAKLPAYMRDLVSLQNRLRRMHAIEQRPEEAGAAEDRERITDAFQMLSLRLTKLLELSLALSSERYSENLLARFCVVAQDIMSCKYAAAGIFHSDGERLLRFGAAGFDDDDKKQLATMNPKSGVLGEVIASGAPHRGKHAQTSTLGLPASHPPISSLLAVPVPMRSAVPLVGWIYFADKANGKPFDREDEQLATTLAAQLSLAHGNLALYEEIQQHAVRLELEVAERRRAQDELAHRMTHDQITGLPRFVLIEEHLQSAIIEAAAQGNRIVVLYVDMDRFHTINETRGRSVGDHVLRVVGERLTAMVHGRGWVAHVAGDEFAAVLLDTTGAKDQLELADAARLRIGKPIQHSEQRVYVTCSVGVSCYPDNGASAQELLREAEAAMLRAKRDGRNAVSAFSNEQKQDLEDTRALGMRLRDAIRDNEFIVHYQPMINGQDWQILGFEALVRWQNPELGLLAPDRFLNVAEELGLIVDIGNFVMETACAQIREWLDMGVSNFTISVNVSAPQLHRPDFVEEIRAALQRWKIPPGYIEVELTESATAENVESVASSMRALKALGVQIALDDFGTGYSSLNYLRHFPADKLKIDQSFVRDITSDASSAGICRTIISLGHQLGMNVLAEGVENAAQVGYLLRNECDYFQGYYFSRPVAATKALDLLRHRYLTQDSALQRPKEQTLLLVDDEENILRALTRALRRDGYRILTATSAREGFELLAEHDVQVIISDQRMPETSGTEFLSQVKQMYPDTLRMVLSGYTDLTAVTDAINRGAIYKFLTKPWNDDELRTQIRDAFRIAQRQERAKSTETS